MPLDIETIRSEFPDRRIDYYAGIGSTMDAAACLAASGCAAGTVVIAEQQTEGRGRYQRPWHSEPESGLYFSLILRPSLPPEALPFTTMALALAAVDAIAAETGIACDLRWPNDVLVDDKKCVGILTQLDSTAIVAGIGVNVNHTAFPEALQSTATSLRIACGRKHSRERLLIALLRAIDKYCELLEAQGKHPILEAFARRSSYVNGRRVQVELGTSLLRGTAVGLSPDGFLIVREDNGTEHIVIAGGVRPCS